MIPSSTKRKQGKGAAAPFPCTPNPRRTSSASLRTISLDDSEHLRHNHRVSVAALRLLFTFAPECRSASLRNRCSPSPEYPHKCGIDVGLNFARDSSRKHCFERFGPVPTFSADSLAPALFWLGGRRRSPSK